MAAGTSGLELLLGLLFLFAVGEEVLESLLVVRTDDIDPFEVLQ